MSMEKPLNILFMSYEELKEDSVAQTKRLAEFLGFPFSMEEEKTGVVNQIIDFCSFNSVNPHQLISHFEIKFYKENLNPDLSKIPSLRLFSTHLSYPILAGSIKRSNCRIVYITRNPFDVVVSLWHFIRGVHNLPDWPLEDCFEMFCRGEESYEELKEDPMSQTKRLPKFLGFPFSMEEEKTGV
ncbi:hypothetical protein Golax_023418, partial [Gossypium laxum]|nr:hypothetical protein [Gossypium laxum]